MIHEFVFKANDNLKLFQEDLKKGTASGIF